MQLWQRNMPVTQERFSWDSGSLAGPDQHWRLFSQQPQMTGGCELRPEWWGGWGRAAGSTQQQCGAGQLQQQQQQLQQVQSRQPAAAISSSNVP
jgi:hypothetical protein